MFSVSLQGYLLSFLEHNINIINAFDVLYAYCVALALPKYESLDFTDGGILLLFISERPRARFAYDRTYILIKHCTIIILSIVLCPGMHCAPRLVV